MQIQQRKGKMIMKQHNNKQGATAQLEDASLLDLTDEDLQLVSGGDGEPSHGLFGPGYSGGQIASFAGGAIGGGALAIGGGMAIRRMMSKGKNVAQDAEEVAKVMPK
jgi:hypothetical protein